MTKEENEAAIDTLKERVIKIAQEKLTEKINEFSKRKFYSVTDNLEAIENEFNFIMDGLKGANILGERSIHHQDEIYGFIRDGKEREMLKGMIEQDKYFKDYNEENVAEVYALRGFLNFFENMNEKLTPEEPVQNNNSNKLKWKGTPASFGYLIFELAKKGFIDFPLHNGEINPTGLAKKCYQLFDINTTESNLIKEMNPNKNSLSDTKRAKFSIPNLEDIS